MRTGKLEDVLRHLRARIAVVSPQHRRWKRFLRELPLDLDEVPRPLVAPTSRDFIICGSPRTGTTLAAAMLFQPPAVVTVTEPWDGMRVPAATLFDSLRSEIEASGRLRRGKLDVAALLRDGATRRWQEGTPTPKIELMPGYRLGVKWPNFWRYLELLPQTKFVLCVRHPIETIMSYRRNGGRLADGLQYDIRFNRRLNRDLESATRDIPLRRVLHYDYIHSRLLPYMSRENVFVVRYERWFDDPQALIDELGAFLEVDLELGPATIRPPGSKPDLDSPEAKFIVEHCRTAESLGYSLFDRVA